MILSDVYVYPWKPVPNDLLLEIPRVGRDADLSLNVNLRDVYGDRMFEAYFRGFVLVDLYVSSAFSQVGSDEVAQDQVWVGRESEGFYYSILDVLRFAGLN